MSPIDLVAQHLEAEGIEHEIVEHERALSAAAEATASGVRPDNATKCVLLRDPTGYTLVVLPASDRLDLGKVAELLQVSRGTMRLATEEEMSADFPEFELGAIPPMGEMLPAPEIVDRRVLDHERVLCNGGDHTHSVLLDPRVLVRAADARIADVSQD